MTGKQSILHPVIQSILQSIHHKNNDDDVWLRISGRLLQFIAVSNAMANIYLQPYFHCFFLRNPVNQMVPGICADDAAHLPNGQGE